jgi:hypothetical protein
MISSSELDVALIKAVLPPADCFAIQKSFFESEHRRRRPDNVPGYILGATHYSKTPVEYFKQCVEAQASVSSIFGRPRGAARSRGGVASRFVRKGRVPVAST